MVARLGLSPSFVYVERERSTNVKLYAFRGVPTATSLNFEISRVKVRRWFSALRRVRERAGRIIRGVLRYLQRLRAIWAHYQGWRAQGGLSGVQGWAHHQGFRDQGFWAGISGVRGAVMRPVSGGQGSIVRGQGSRV